MQAKKRPRKNVNQNGEVVSDGIAVIIFGKYEFAIFVRDKIFFLLNFIARTIILSALKPRALPWAVS